MSTLAVIDANASPGPGDENETSRSLLNILSTAGSPAGATTGASVAGADGSPPATIASAPSPPSSACKHAYELNNSCKKVLLSMCLGLEGNYPAGDDGPASSRKLGDITIEPYASSKTKNLWKPTTKHLADEVLCCFEILNIPKKERFRPKNKVLPRLMTWLSEHPIVDTMDVAFLLSEEKKLFDDLATAADKAAALAEAHAVGGGNGVIFTFVADLQMIHSLIDPMVKESYLVRHIPMNREELDARNSPNRPKTAWDEILRDKFNDVCFAPNSNIFPSLHSNFAESHDLHQNQCPTNVTTENVRTWVADRKAKLVILINRWELSGTNGDGQRVDTDAEFGNVSADSIQFQEGDNRSSILRHERSTLLYYWEMLVKEDMLQNSVSILPATVGVSSSQPTGHVWADEDGFTTPAGRCTKKRNAIVSNDELERRDDIETTWQPRCTRRGFGEDSWERRFKYFDGRKASSL